MFDCSTLPDENERLAEVQVELARLSDDTPASAPLTIGELMKYLALEVPGGDKLTTVDLEFQRTADLGDAQYWVWSLFEPDTGDRAFAIIRQDPDGSLRSYDTDYYGLSAEQFVLGHYCGCW